MSLHRSKCTLLSMCTQKIMCMSTEKFQPCTAMFLAISMCSTNGTTVVLYTCRTNLCMHMLAHKHMYMCLVHLLLELHIYILTYAVIYCFDIRYESCSNRLIQDINDCNPTISFRHTTSLSPLTTEELKVRINESLLWREYFYYPVY